MARLLVQVVSPAPIKQTCLLLFRSCVTLSVVRELQLPASVDEWKLMARQQHLPAAPKGKLLSFRLSQPPWLRML